MTGTPLRRRLRLLRRGIGYGTALLLVLVALVIGVASQVLPLAERNPDKIAAWLSVRAHNPVVFDAVQTQWTRRGPLLRLDNLRVGHGKDAVHIGDAEILVAQYTGLLPGRSLTELRVRGLDLTLQRDATGRWQVRGLPGQQQDTDGDPFATLERLGELQVSDARLRVLAPELGVDMQLPRIDLRMRVDGPRIRAGARAWLHTGGTPFSAALDFNRVNGNGNAYAGTGAAKLSELADDLQVGGISVVSGQGRVQAWAGLREHRVVSVHADAALQQVVVRGTALKAGEPPPTQVLAALEVDARWAGSIAQWRADASTLRIGEGKAQQVLDGLAVAGGKQYGLRASGIDAAPLLAFAALGNRLPSGLRTWLLASSAGVSLDNVVVAGERGGELRVDARLRDLHFAAVGNAPGMTGIDASLEGDAHALQLRFDPQGQVVLDWPAGFGVAHAMTLDGDVLAWREGDGWNVQTPGLAIGGKQFSANARGGMGFPNDGTRPRMDLAVDIDDAQVTAARNFWVHHLMSKATVDWLNAALQGGTLRDVHAVVAGDLDDWPFNSEGGRAGAGKFRVDARIVDGVVKFQPDWPAAEHLDADIRFEADGFTIDGRGQLAGVAIESLSAGIPRFGHAQLRVDAMSAGDAGEAGKLLAMLRASPLQKAYGEVMDNLQVSGAARADFHLLLPFHHEGNPVHAMHGSVMLADASMREKRWDLAFDKVNGRVQYDGNGFIADKLQVLHDGVAGVLSLRAGPHVRDPKQAFEGELQASVGIDSMLDKAGNLAWLKPYMEGRSMWTVALGIPKGEGASAPTRLQLRSNLVGTAINLPEPVRKPAAQPLAASIDMALPLERGEVGVTLGDLLSLRSRSDARQTGIRVQFGSAADAPPAHGLVIGGRAGRVDALDWIGVFAGDGTDGTVPLRRIDVMASQLHLLGADFADTRLVLVPAPGGTAVQVQGAGISGSLLVPQQDRALVAGRFDRLHWRKPSKPATASVQAVMAATHDSTTLAFDPARIPPMLFEVAELHVGDAALGSARFRSTPVASGLRVDEFSARSPKQRMSASGSWTGRNEAARTQLKLDVDSGDIGVLLAGLGLAGQVDGGKGTLGGHASWRGGPEAFDPMTVQASLSLDARDGRLLELEPGAGRVLGLLGIAQLPRRLTLDFRDFFEKGFAFDHITADVRLAQGNARTDNLTIQGPAADIHVRGSADLRTQRFDQTVDVLPKSGGLLTAVGAIAGGPVGAAVGAVANAMLDKPLQGLGAKTYQVTGPWASPTVEVSARSGAGKPALPAQSRPVQPKSVPARPVPARPAPVGPPA